MNCIMCGKELATPEAKLAILNEKQSAIEAEINRLENSPQKKGLSHRRQDLEAIKFQIKMFKKEKHEDKLCPDCNTVIGEIIEKKIDVKLEGMLDNILDILEDSISIEFHR